MFQNMSVLPKEVLDCSWNTLLVLKNKKSKHFISHYNYFQRSFTNFFGYPGILGSSRNWFNSCLPTISLRTLKKVEKPSLLPVSSKLYLFKNIDKAMCSSVLLPLRYLQTIPRYTSTYPIYPAELTLSPCSSGNSLGNSSTGDNYKQKTFTQQLLQPPESEHHL